MTVDEIVETVKDLPWELRQAGMIQCIITVKGVRKLCCPLTAACFLKNNTVFDLTAYKRAGEGLGLSASQAYDIAVAADNGHYSSPSLREKLLTLVKPKKKEEKKS